jgi:hypothetical protein
MSNVFIAVFSNDKNGAITGHYTKFLALKRTVVNDNFGRQPTVNHLTQLAFSFAQTFLTQATDQSTSWLGEISYRNIPSQLLQSSKHYKFNIIT